MSVIIYYQHYAYSVRDVIVFPQIRVHYYYVWIFSKTEGKISVVKNYPDTCGRGPENPAPLPAPLQALILDISQPIHTRAIKFALLHLTLLDFSLLYI